MIVNHTTGEILSAANLRRLFPSICAPGNPLIGQPGYRTAWADESDPTDAELRLIGYSLLVETQKPTPGDGEQVRQGPHKKVGDEWRQTWIVEPIPVVVPERVESHKIKIELSAQGLRQAVEDLLAQASSEVKDAWIAPYFHRTSIFIDQFRQMMAMTHPEVDQIFINANERQT